MPKPLQPWLTGQQHNSGARRALAGLALEAARSLSVAQLGAAARVNAQTGCILKPGLYAGQRCI